MITACFGLHKSASTYTWQITSKILLHHFDGNVIHSRDVVKIGKDFLDEYIEHVQSANCAIVQKTHSRGDRDVVKMAESGHLKVIANIRDPRDIALSMIDAGIVERSKGHKNAMSEVVEFEDTINAIQRDIDRLDWWSQKTNPLIVKYNDVCFEPEAAVEAISVFLTGKPIPEETSREILSSIPKNGIRFNVGKLDRYKSEMSDDKSEMILDIFQDFYRKYDLPTS